MNNWLQRREIKFVDCFLGWVDFSSSSQWNWCIHAYAYLLNAEIMVNEIAFPAMLNVLAKKLEALHVSHYCLATGENRLFCEKCKAKHRSNLDLMKYYNNKSKM